jgi:uncharacterized membrane protein YgdD (TMEM256/DUF423 family)
MSWIKVAAVVGFLGVALGAFGAHGLRGRISESLLGAYQTGVLYHLVHAGVLVALALYARATSAAITLPASLVLAGIVLFSGSLYAMALTGIGRFGMVTPLGGLCFLAGWLSMLALR